MTKALPSFRKVIIKSQLSSTHLQRLTCKAQSIKALTHPNIVKVFQVMDSPEALFLLLEYVSGGDVFEYLVNHSRITGKEA